MKKKLAAIAMANCYGCIVSSMPLPNGRDNAAAEENSRRQRRVSRG